MNAVRLGVVVILLVAVAMGASASDVVYPKPVSSALPMYPERARAVHVAGTVRLWFVLNGNGEVSQAEVVSGNPMLCDAAVYTVKSWKFRPNSIPPNVRHETQFVYVLRVQSREGEPRLIVSMTDFRRIEIVSETYTETIE